MAETVLFDRYRLLEQAGMGGSAQVWRALDTETGETVAVKRLHPVVFADPAARHRLERESRALEALVHPNVVALRDVRIEDDEAALILDYVDGTSLAERIDGGPPFAVGEVVGVVRDVAAALTAAHAVGIVHRDVKPGNVILGTDGRALLTDFGISSDATAGDAAAGGALTATGTIVGTFRYMAPEQLRGSRATPATDQYALAAVAYELLAGRAPYAATTPVALAEEQAVLPVPPDGARPELSAAVMRGLSPDPNDRYPDVAAFASAVAGAVRAGTSAMLTEVAAAVPAAALAGAIPSDGDRAAGPERAVARRVPGRRAGPRWAPAGALAAALLAGVVVVAAMSNGEAPPDQAAGSDAPTATPVAASATPVAASATPELTPTPPPDDDGGSGDDGGDGDGNGNGGENGNKPDKPDKPDKGKGNGNGGG